MASYTVFKGPQNIALCRPRRSLQQRPSVFRQKRPSGILLSVNELYSDEKISLMFCVWTRVRSSQNRKKRGPIFSMQTWSEILTIERGRAFLRDDDHMFVAERGFHWLRVQCERRNRLEYFENRKRSRCRIRPRLKECRMYNKLINKFIKRKLTI